MRKSIAIGVFLVAAGLHAVSAQESSRDWHAASEWCRGTLEEKETSDVGCKLNSKNTNISTISQNTRLAQLQESNNIRGCFVRIYDRIHLAQHPDQTVTAIKLKIYRNPSNSDRDWFSIRVQKRGEVKALHNEGYCETGGPSAKCYVECDGGGFRLDVRSKSSVLMRLGIQPPFGPNGEVIKQDERIRMAPCGQEDSDSAEDELKGGKDDHEFLLFSARESECAELSR